MIEVGSPYTSSLSVVNSLGSPADAATVQLTVSKPDQTTDVYQLADGSVTRDGLGQYHVDYIPPFEGLYKFTWQTTGINLVKTDYMNASAFRSIIGVDEARLYVGETTTTRDDLLRQVLMALTEKIESIVGITVPKRFVDETVTGYNAFTIRMPHAPLLNATAVESVSSLYTGGPTWTSDEIIQYPDSATCELRSMLPFWYGPWKATYTAGRAVIPMAIQYALKEALLDFWADEDLDPGSSPAQRWETAITGYDLTPHAKSLLEQYELPGFA